MNYWLLLFLAATGDEPAPENAGPSESAVQLFVAKCLSCHAIGEGDRVGPDLKNVHTRRDADWLKRMIQTPGQILDSDPAGQEMLAKYNNVRMPDLGLGDDSVQALVELIQICSAQPCKLGGKLKPVTEATPDDAKRGLALFLGNERMANGAPACVSCHAVRGASSILAGGSLSVDLTQVFARLGEPGLDAALRNPSFPVMNKIFSEHPLKENEAFLLRAFLYRANNGKLSEIAGTETPQSVLLAGVLGAGLSLFVLNWFWSRRLTGVRRPMVARRRQA